MWTKDNIEGIQFVCEPDPQVYTIEKGSGSGYWKLCWNSAGSPINIEEPEKLLLEHLNTITTWKTRVLPQFLTYSIY